MKTDPKQDKKNQDAVSNKLDGNQQRTDPNITELKGLTEPGLPLEPTEPDPDEVPDDPKSNP